MRFSTASMPDCGCVSAFLCDSCNAARWTGCGKRSPNILQSRRQSLRAPQRWPSRHCMPSTPWSCDHHGELLARQASAVRRGGRGAHAGSRAPARPSAALSRPSIPFGLHNAELRIDSMSQTWSVLSTSLIKRFASTEEVATMVTYIASPLASATTGAALRVDGGVVKSAF